MNVCRRSVARAAGIAPLLLLLAVAISAEATKRAIKKPWGVSCLSSGALIVMESGGGMLRVFPERRRLQVLEPEFGAFLAVDVTAGPAGADEEAIFVSLRLKTPRGAEFNRLRQYSVRGKVTREAEISPSVTFAGIAADPAHGRVWMVDSQSSEIHEFTFRGSGSSSVSSRRLVRLRGVEILGPLAFDSESDRLFVADSVRGTVYGVSLDTLDVEEIAGGLGEPQDLAVDGENRGLYVADPGGRRIWRIDLASPGSSARVHSRIPELRSPVGIAVAPDGTVWIADPEANKLFALGPDGGVVTTIP